MAFRLKTFISFLISLALTAGFVAPASASGPQITVVSISKSSLSPGESLRVEYRITDDGQCCNPHDVYMYDPAGAWVTRVQGSRVSGTDQNSVWAANITVPVNSQGQNQGSALTAGTYTFRTQTTDAQNNYSDLVLLGSVSIVVSAPTPAPEPTDLSPTIQAQNITATLTSDFATLTVNVPDAKGWTWSVIWDNATRRTGITSFPFEANVGWSGNKTIQLYATNSAGNWGYSTQFNPTVLAPPVPIAPQISVVSINKTSLAPGETLRVEYRITDDGQCCNPHDVYMYDGAGAWVTRAQGTKISGTSQNGIWAATITVPINSQGQNQGRVLTAGTYTFRTQTTDAQNNFSDLVLLGSVSVVVSTPDPTPSNPTSSPGVPSVGGQPAPAPNASATVTPSPSPSTSPTSSPAVTEIQPPVATAPSPTEVAPTAVTSVQRALSAFTAVILGAAQKKVVEKLLDDAPNSERLICTAIRFAGNSAAANLLLRKQAKAVCDFAKSQNPDLSVWVQSKPTTARSFAGRVLLVARG